MSSSWVNDSNAALLTDFYELTMLQSYYDEGMKDTSVFDLFVRRLPRNRNYMVACGLEHVLAYLETVAFSRDAIEYLRSLGRFSETFLKSLAEFRFTGDVYAVPEGTAVFANEPILEIVAPLPQAQLTETFLMNQIQLAMLAASKAARVVRAARERPVVDFGLRRMHGADAGLKEARAFYIAGVDATSSVLSAKTYGIPASGTMAHSYIQAFDTELEAFRRFVRSFPDAMAGLRMFDASIVPPLTAPAPTMVWISSMKRIASLRSMSAVMSAFNRCSNSPRYFVPASSAPMSSDQTSADFSTDGISSL